MFREEYKKAMSNITPDRTLLDRTKSAIRSEMQEERTVIYMKRKWWKAAVITAAIAVVCVTSVLAAVNFDVLKEFFAGDTSLLQQLIKTPRESVSDGRFKLTLEEMLTDNYYVFMVYSVEGLTDDAIAELMDADDLIHDNRFAYHISVSPSPGVSAGTSTAYPAHSREIKEKRTSTKRYWTYYDEMDNVKDQPLRLRLDRMDGEQYIAVPTDTNVEVKELTLKGHPCGDVEVRISPIGMVLDKGTKSGLDIDVVSNEVFFRMKDGQIKTYNQLASAFKGCMASGDWPDGGSGYTRYRYNARFRDTVPLSDFKSIIIGNLEYDINDPIKVSEITLDKSMYPVEVEALLLKQQAAWLPVRETGDRLGAEVAWDGERLMIRYRGSTVEITDHSKTYTKDGKTVAYQMPQTNILCVYEDRLYINWGSLCESIGLDALPKDRPEMEKSEMADSAGGWVYSPRTPQYIRYYIIP